MKEVKFRAWDKVLKQMRIDVMWWSGDKPGDWIEFMSERENPYPVERFEITQFTGLLDKNGKEIYEGDIITTQTDVGNGVVEWRGNHFGVGFAVCAKDGEMIDMEDDWSDLEVIGNIWEQPELLNPSTQSEH